MFSHTLYTKQETNKTTYNSLPKTICRWQVADIMKMNVEATIFKEMLATLDSSEDHWDMEKPQAKRGEVKYWLNDKECFSKLKEFECDTENTGKSKQGVLKGKKSEGTKAIQSEYPLHDNLMNITQDAMAVVGNYRLCI